MKDIGYGKGYEYDHHTADGFSGQNYFPDNMGREEFYRPVERGFERQVQDTLGRAPSHAIGEILLDGRLA